MIDTKDLANEVSDIGQAIGLIGADGGLNIHWFENPAGGLQSIFKDPTQRAGLMNFLDALLPPAAIDGLPPGEKWHPLLGTDSSLRGNVYLTVKDNGANVVFGVAGDYSTSQGTTPAASLRARLPLFSANSGVHAVAGTSDGPLSVELRLTLGWTRPAQPITLAGVIITASLAPLALGGPQASLVVKLAGLDLDGSGAKDTILDPNQLGSEATHLILGLIQYELKQLAGGLSAEQQAVVNHLLPLVGLGGGAIPPFPFLELVSDPQAIQKWFASIPLQNWLAQLAGLLGSSTAITGTGTVDAPWLAQIFTLNASTAFNVTLAQTADTLEFGALVKVAPDGPNPVARIEARAVLASFPLKGTAAAAVLPSAAVLVRAPGSDGAAALIDKKPAIAVDSLHAGFVWNGTSLQPVLQLDTVTLGGIDYPHLDLTNADSVVNAAETAVLNNLTAALGGGAGQHIAALAGIIKPTGDPVAVPHLIEAKVLVTNPARAIGAVHRAILVDPQDNWSYMFGDLTALLGLAGPASGTGTEADPWRVTLGSAGPLNLEFAAWNAATAHGAADVQKLRIGLRVSASPAPVQLWWLAELLAIDLPQDAEGSIALLASQHAQLVLSPLPAIPPTSNFTIAADSVQARFDWNPGGNAVWSAGVQNVQITVGAAPAIAIPAINFPLPAIDVTNPAGAAAALGISVPQLELVLRLMLARAVLSWGGMPAYVAAALLGVHADLPGLPANWPTLADPGSAGSLLSDPFTALRQWLAQLCVSADPSLLSGLNWLQALLSNALPPTPQDGPPGFDASIAGSGTYEDPWALPLTSIDPDLLEALVWLEPAGPPATWAKSLATAATAAGDFGTTLGVAAQLAGFVPALRSALAAGDTTQLAASLDQLANYFASSDGVVPLSSQIPTGGSWQAGTAINASHDQQPADPSAIAQITAQADTWAGGGGGARAVLLLAPSFSTHAVWSTFLGGHAFANFDFRTTDPDPLSVNLNTVTDAVDYYTADLREDGSNNPASLVAQIGKVVQRIGELRPGVPVTLVAHSTMGVPARVFTAANPAQVKGLITLGTPHAGAPLPFFTDTGIGSAVRLVQQLLPSMPAGPVNSAITHIVRALDGYATSANANAVAAAAPYPVAAFNFAGAGSTDTKGVPALALGGTLSSALLDQVRQAVAAMATTAASAATPAPTHFSCGIRAKLDLGPSPASAVEVTAKARIDAFRVALSKPAAAITRPERALSVRLQLSRPGDWLIGGPSSYDVHGNFVDVRVRWAELGMDISPNAKPFVALHQTSFHGPMSPGILAFTDAATQPLLGAVFAGITLPAPAAGTSLGGLISALQSLGVMVPDTHAPGAFGLSADAWSAIAVDAAGYLGPRLAAALNSGIAGFTGAGPWLFNVSELPVQAYVSTAPAAAGIRTSSIPISSNASLAFDLNTTSIGATLQLGVFKLMWANGTLTASAPPWLDPIRLIPAPGAAALEAALSNALPRLLLSGAFTAVLEGILGPGIQIPPIDSFFSSPGKTIGGSSGLGSASGLDAGKINQLLQVIAQVLRLPPAPGLNLPANLRLIAEGSGTATDPTSLHLLTTADIGGILGIDLAAKFDSTLHVTPAGQVKITVALPGNWTSLVITFGASASGVSLTLAPQLAGVAPIQVLPTFSGLGDFLRGALDALLPKALDELVNALGPVNPGTVLQGALDVATAFGIYDAAGGFKTHAPALRALTQGNFLAAFGGSRAGVATAIANLFAIPALAGSLPGSVSANAGTVTWKETFGGAISGAAAVSLGWDGSGPTAALSLSDVKLSTGGLTAALSAGYGSGTLQCSTELAVSLASTLGLDVNPKLRAAVNGGRFSVALLPLASGNNDGPVQVNIAPTPGVTLDAAGAQGLVTHLLLPLAGSLVLSAVKPNLSHNLWTGGPTVESVLKSAKLITNTDTLASPLPDLTGIVSGLLQALAGNLKIPVSSTLHLSLISDGGGGSNRLGLALSGTQTFTAGSYLLKIHFGAPSEWGAGMDEGLGLYLFQTGGGAGGFDFKPGLHCVGIGFGITGQDDTPLIDLSQFRLGGLDGYVFFDVDFSPAINILNFGAGLELDAFGIPLGQATGGGVGGNPVAAGLLQSGGAPGDNHPVNPGVDVGAWLVPHAIVPSSDGNFHIRFGDKQDQALWIPVHAGFGPIYIDQLGVGVTSDPGVELLIDGSVKVDGLTAQANELGVTIPFKSLANPAGWSLDLGGLALAFTSPGVTIAGGLIKNPGPPIEYDGMLLIQVTQFGFVAVGAYSRPTDAEGGYTSLFVFAGVFIVIGLPPIIEIEGLGLGVGYDRELIVPDDMNKIPSFILVAALDDAGKFANDPMGELMQIRDSIPARRGSFWLAVGLHGTSFVIVHVTAVVYVALDRGVEVGVLGVARMALPSDDTALVSIELALKARFSTAEGILSIQAQLTNNSWLLSKDCQLTGGFAYFMWFPQSQFVLTIGGYNPNYQKPAQFPDVPRLGFHWSLFGAINIKGESYFALTNTCVMAGTRMEATYGPDCIHIWFTAYTDFLLSWDPFHYDVQIGIAVGAEFHMEICFIGCVDIDISVSLGASLHILGPPLHGEVTVDLAICSVTVAFGPDPKPKPQYITDFGQFALKYLYGNDPSGYAVAAHVLTGLLPPEPAGAKPTPGTADQPWRMGIEWSFQTETRMPATSATAFTAIQPDSQQISEIDFAPMGLAVPHVGTAHGVTLEQLNGANWGAATFSADHFTLTRVVNQYSQATWHYFDPDNVPAAAQTIPAIGGLQIVGFAVPQNQSALIPIATLIDAGNPRPLPFATLTLNIINVLVGYGTAAEQLGQLAAATGSGQTSSAAGVILSGSGYFSQARAAVGIPAPGLPPVALNALKTYRSAPPLITPITTGLTMRNVGLARPPVIRAIAPAQPLPLEQPRLRAVLQARARATSDAPAALRTSVAKAAPGNIPRMAPPKLDAVMGARLVRVPAANAVRPTVFARSTKTLRNPEAGWAAPAAHAEAIRQAEADFVAKGVTLAAGAAHVWDIPPGSAALNIRGTAAVRVTFLSRSGGVLDDREFVPGGQSGNLPIPAKTERIIAQCLGNLPAATAAGLGSGFGAISASAASPGNVAATGWQAASMLMQAGASLLLARGASVRLPRPFTATRSGNKTNQSVIRASEVMRDETAVETSLPVKTAVVMVLLDRQDATAAEQGDFAIGCTGATLVTPPLAVAGGARRALLYQVSQLAEGASSITISTASSAGWRVSGVVGLPGQAQEWAVRANGGVPEHLVPEGPLTPDGEVTIAFLTTGANA